MSKHPIEITVGQQIFMLEQNNIVMNYFETNLHIRSNKKILLSPPTSDLSSKVEKVQKIYLSMRKGSVFSRNSLESPNFTISLQWPRVSFIQIRCFSFPLPPISQLISHMDSASPLYTIAILFYLHASHMIYIIGRKDLHRGKTGFLRQHLEGMMRVINY